MYREGPGGYPDKNHSRAKEKNGHRGGERASKICATEANGAMRPKNSMRQIQIYKMAPKS